MAEQLNVSDITIDKLLIHAASGAYDLIPHLSELNIYENIFSNHLTGNITLVDGYNIPQKLPIIGEETIECKMRMTGAPDDDKLIMSPPLMQVHDLADRFIREGKHSQQFTLKLVSEKFMSNLHSRISRSYSEPASEIVREIYEEYLNDGRSSSGGQQINIEPSYGTETCIIPNWDPHTAFNWLASRARSKKNEHAVSYVYFETLEGSHFKTLQTLATQPAMLTISLTPRAFDAHQIEALFKGQVKADHILYMNQFRIIDNVKSGMYASKLLTHDITTKKIAQFDYSGFDDWDTYTHLSPHPPINNSPTEYQVGNTFRNSYAPPRFDNIGIEGGRRMSDYTDSIVTFYPKHNQMFGTTSSEPYENHVEEWRLQREAHMSFYNGVTMEVQCCGLQFARGGMTIVLIVPAPHGGMLKPDDSWDKFLTGKYMVTAIRHIISNDKGSTSYKMNLQLTKDGINNFPGYRQPRKLGKESVAFV